jgi:signal recognition particle receptor subunit beta
MPSYDSARNCHIVRIVYDGPGMAGKTTNLKKICDVIPSSRRSEMYTPAELKGRTMFFDWLEVDVGVVAKMPVTCQVLSVPGQRARSYRRRPLIHTADAVVYVADSREGVWEETRRVYALMRRYLRERGEPVPYLVQANKRDAEDAMPVETLRATLRLPEPVPMLPAVAASGEGVIATFAAACKAAIRFAHAQVAERGIEGISGAAQNADDLFDALLTLEDNVEEQEQEQQVSGEEALGDAEEQIEAEAG